MQPKHKHHLPPHLLLPLTQHWKTTNALDIISRQLKKTLPYQTWMLCSQCILNSIPTKFRKFNSIPTRQFKIAHERDRSSTSIISNTNKISNTNNWSYTNIIFYTKTFQKRRSNSNIIPTQTLFPKHVLNIKPTRFHQQIFYSRIFQKHCINFAYTNVNIPASYPIPLSNYIPTIDSVPTIDPLPALYPIPTIDLLPIVDHTPTLFFIPRHLKSLFQHKHYIPNIFWLKHQHEWISEKRKHKFNINATIQKSSRTQQILYQHYIQNQKLIIHQHYFFIPRHFKIPTQTLFSKHIRIITQLNFKT